MNKKGVHAPSKGVLDHFEIVDDMAYGILCIDFSGNITTCNKRAAAILKKARSEVLHQNFWSLFDDRYLGFSLKDALSNKSQIKGVTTTLKGESIHKPQVIECYTTFSSEGMIISIHDITHILLMEKLKAKNNHALKLQEMAAMLAHEIRNPLGGLKGFASLLKRDLAAQPECLALATYIATGIDDLETTLNDVLNHYHHLHRKQTDLVPLVNDLLHHIQADASIASNIELTYQGSETTVEAFVDPLAIKSALLNLCSNAIKAMPQGGRLTLGVEGSASESRITVKDTGEGISTENLEKLFEPFFTTHLHGHGFGLCEVLQVVEAHEGTIDTHSELNKGTTFTIHIPRHSKRFI